MKNSFVIDQKSLLAILSSMQPICTKRTTLNATSYILFHVGHKELVLKSTDLEISLQSSYILNESSIDEPVSFLVSGRRIFDLVKEMEGDIEFTLKKQQIGLRAGAVNLALNIKEAEEFPPFPERIENLMQLDASFVLSMLNKVAFLIPQNNTNSALNGLYLEISHQDLKMTTTDGHCLAQVSTPKYTLDHEQKWLLPRRAIFEVKKLLEAAPDKALFLGTCGNQLVFSGESFNFFTKLLVDPFPQYQAILNREGFTAATVDRSHLMKTLRRSVCLLSGQFIATEFGFDPEMLHVKMENKEVGKLQEEVPVEGFELEHLDIRFYAPYVLNGLQAFSEDRLQFYLKHHSNPIIFESNNDESHLKYLVMPVSISNPHNA